MKRILIFLLFLLILPGCATTKKTVFEGEPKSEAEMAYRAAVRTLENGANEDAIKEFHAIKLKYPYATRWATLCDLRIADAYRASSEYSQAAVSYQTFIRTYPAHPEIPYAMYSAADCYYEMMPSDMFLLPDPWQRDRKSTAQAETALSIFIKRYPDDENTPKAKEQYAEVRRRLSNHELYVAEYDFKHKAYRGAVNRLEGLIKSYPESAVVPKAHILLAHSYIELKDPVSAKRTLEKLIETYPDDEYSSDARAWISRNPDVP